MKIDYDKTIGDLKARGLIADGDKYAVCRFQAESKSNGITTTVITSKVDYVMSANDDEIKLFDVDKKTGEYLDDYIAFKKADVIYEKKIKRRKFIYASKGLFGGMYVSIHFIAEDFVHTYNLPKKINGYEQLGLRSQLYDFVKATYNAYYDAQKKTYKENK